MDVSVTRVSRLVALAVAITCMALVFLVFSGCACSNNSSDYASEDDTGYIATWVGKLDSTTTGPACYAGQENPIEITVKSVETTGRMVVDAKALYHGHSNYDLPGDVDSFQGDKVVSLTDQTTTLENNGFSIVAEQGDTGEITIEGTWTGIGDSLALEAVVKSRFGGYIREDVYTLAKK